MYMKFLDITKLANNYDKVYVGCLVCTKNNYSVILCNH